MKAVRYRVPSRIAIDLYDMNGDLGRIDGGIGFSLEYPMLVFEATKSPNKKIYYNKEMGHELRESIEKALEKTKSDYKFDGIELKIKESIPEHLGFGSKTATLLSIVHVYGQLYDIDFDFKKLGVYLGRGGTSGIGINIIDKGGFILEGGHSTKKKKTFTPSSATKVITSAPLLARYDMPDWDILIVIPETNRTYGLNEIRFFKSICPVSKRDVEKLARITLSQVLPAVYEQDLEMFCKGINSIQKSYWKNNEISIYKNDVRKVMKYLKSKGALGIGMSSIGPSIYTFGGDLKNILMHLKKTNLHIKDAFLTKANNTGLKIERLK